jgi:hypothetical protein
MAYLSGADWTLETPKRYIILGCQRSGTSFLANAIRDQGVYFGTQGWRGETSAFWAINKSIIQSAGGTWREIPSEAALLAQGELHREQIIDRINDFNSKADLWGCKDPRMALTARSWLDLLGDDVYLIAIFRRPELTAASLMRKGQISGVDAGTRHAREYARRIISAIKEFVGV